MTDRSSTALPGARPALTPGIDGPRPVIRDDTLGHRASGIATLVLEHWFVVLCAGLACGLIVVGILLSTARKYEAAVTVAPIANTRQLSLPAGLAGTLLGAAGGGGLQATPVFVARLARLNSVLSSVALTHVPGDTTHVVIERVLDQPLSSIPPHTYATEIGKVLLTTVDRESGTVTLRVALSDSSLARTTVNVLVAAVRRTYARTNKSQGSELREAQVTRMDSASRQLWQAQAAVVNFTASNRAVPAYSSAWAEGQRLQNNLQIAQQVYAAAVADVQTAQGKELEDAPALVVLDSVPSFLPPRSRGTVSLGIIAFLFGALVGFAFLVVREAATNALRFGDPDAQRLMRAISRLPLVSGPVFRWFVRERQGAPDGLRR